MSRWFGEEVGGSQLGPFSLLRFFNPEFFAEVYAHGPVSLIRFNSPGSWGRWFFVAVVWPPPSRTFFWHLLRASTV
jgi:hypothetical protein